MFSKIRILFLLVLLFLGGCTKEVPSVSEPTPKSGILSFAREIVDPNQQPVIETEAFVRLTHGKFENLPLEATAMSTFKKNSSMRFFALNMNMFKAKLDPSGEYLMGCAHGPQPRVLVTKAQHKAIKKAHGIVLGVSGNNFTRPDVKLLKNKHDYTQWFFKTAATTLRKTYDKLPASKKIMVKVDPVFIQYFQFPKEDFVYGLASYRLAPVKKGDYFLEDAPVVFLIARFDKSQTPQLLNQKLTTNTETTTDFTLVDLVGDTRPELVTLNHGYEWYYFDIYSLEPTNTKLLWRGGGGGC